MIAGWILTISATPVGIGAEAPGDSGVWFERGLLCNGGVDPLRFSSCACDIENCLYGSIGGADRLWPERSIALASGGEYARYTWFVGTIDSGV